MQTRHFFLSSPETIHSLSRRASSGTSYGILILELWTTTHCRQRSGLLLGPSLLGTHTRPNLRRYKAKLYSHATLHYVASHSRYYQSESLLLSTPVTGDLAASDLSWRGLYTSTHSNTQAVTRVSLGQPNHQPTARYMPKTAGTLCKGGCTLVRVHPRQLLARFPIHDSHGCCGLCVVHG